MILWLKILISVYCIAHGLAVFIWGSIVSTPGGEDGRLFWNPWLIHKCNKVNWFGAIFIYLLYFAIVPMFALIGLFIWLCTVGRE